MIAHTSPFTVSFVRKFNDKRSKSMAATQKKLVTTKRFGRFALACLFAGTMFVGSVHADYYGGDTWSASAATAVPEFFPTGDINSFTVINSPHGRGVESNAGPTFDKGVIRSTPVQLFIPVTASAGSSFDTIWLRARDNTRDGSVTAALYRQPIHQPGPAERLGSVTTQDLTNPPDGFQIATALLKQPESLAPGVYSYYIQLTLVNPVLSVVGTVPNITAYDVGLQAQPSIDLCRDGIDNDHDGKIDCEDIDCFAAPGAICL